MTTYYKATFSDGTVLKRSTASRKYTHAYLVRGHYEAPEWMVTEGRAQPGQMFAWGSQGFSGSQRLADKAAGASFDRAPEFREVAPAIEITRQEYKALGR